MTARMKDYSDRLVQDGVAIFLFHGVVDRVETEVRNYTRKHLPADDFSTVLQALKARGNAVSIDQIVAGRAGEESIPEYAFAVTFDDGFENNLTIAAPLLAQARVPATFYVSTDFVDRNRMSWIDRIEYVVAAAARGHLNLPWATVAFDDAASKRRLLDAIRREVKSTSSIAPDELASDVQQQLGFSEIWSSSHPLDQKMNWSQVAKLAAMPGCTVGGHSHTHAILSFLDDESLRAEIDTSLRLLNEKAGVIGHHYSYPEGLAHCFDDRVIRILKERGVVCAPTAIDGVNDAGVDLFHLRRIFVI